jgi:hypothetical protein
MKNQMPNQPTNLNREYVSDILEADVSDGRLPTELADMLDQDYPLANLTSADRKFFRLMSENIEFYAEERYPREDSIHAGVLGAALTDSYDVVEAIPNVGKSRNETALLDHYARTSRAVDGWQQDKFGETIQTNRVEDNRGEETDKGIRGWL